MGTSFIWLIYPTSSFIERRILLILTRMTVVVWGAWKCLKANDDQQHQQQHWWLTVIDWSRNILSRLDILSQPMQWLWWKLIEPGRGCWLRTLISCEDAVSLLLDTSAGHASRPSLRHQGIQKQHGNMWGGGTTLTRINRMLCFATGMYLFMGGGMNSISFMCLHCLTVGKLTELKSEYNVNAAGILWQRKWCVKDVLFVISLSWPTALLLGSHNMSLFLAFHQTIFCRSPSKVTLLLKIRAAASDCPTWRTVESVHRLCNERNRTSCPKVIFFKPKTCRYYNLPYQ